MKRLKNILHVGLLTGLLVIMLSVFTMQVDAANITYNLSDMTSSNNKTVIGDGEAYTTVLSPSSDYRLPDSILIVANNSEVLKESDFSYSPTTGNLSIRAESVKGDLIIYGIAVKLKAIELPTIKGNFVVYETLSAVISPSDATVTYQWYRGDKAINGATSPNYTLTAKDIGEEINVQITGTGDYGGQKISTSNTLISKKKQPAPSQSDVVVTNVSKNLGTDGAIVSNSELSMEYYDTVSATWRILPARSKAAGEYQVRFRESSDTLPSESVMIRIFEPCTAPVPTDVTITHLTVAGSATGKMTANTTKVLEYHNGTAWVTFPVQGLTAGKYRVRFAETTDYLASAPEYFYVKEPTTLVITPPDVTVTHVTAKGAATGVMKPQASNSPIMEAQVDGLWRTLPLSTLKAGVYQVRYAATDTTFPSASCEVIIKEPADPPADIKVTDVTTHGGNDGAIRSLKTTWQVSYDGKVWNDCTQTALTGLSAGNYYFRTRETEMYLPSDAVMVTVKQPEITPEAIIDYVNGTLKNLTPGAQYAVDGIDYTVDRSGTISILENNLTGRSIDLIKKGNGTTTIDSLKQTIEIPARPAMPDAPMITKKTDTTVTVSFTVGLEYSIDGKSWLTAANSSYTFTGLSANTAYTVFSRVKAVEGSSFCSANAGTNVTTKKDAAAAAPATAVATTEITDKTITVQVVSGQEYRIGNGAWILPAGSTHTFDGLTQTTVYSIQTRMAETADTMPGVPLTAEIATYTKLTVASKSVDFFKRAIFGLAPGTYVVNSLPPVIVGDDGLLDVEDYFGRSVTVKRLGSVETRTVDSDPVTVEVISPVAAPTAEQVNLGQVLTSLTEIILPTPDPALEYQLLNMDGLPISEWKSSDGTAQIIFGGLTHSTPYRLQVSFKQTETKPKSNAFISDPIYTRFYEEMPTAVVDTVGDRLTGLKPGSYYIIGDMILDADENGHIKVLAIWRKTTISIIKCGDGVTTVDGPAQLLSVPGRVPNLTAATVSPITYHGGANGVISNLTAEMEYSTDRGETWIPISAEKLEGLSAGRYEIRYRAVPDTYFAGMVQVVEVTLDTVLADHKEAIIKELEQAYSDLASSNRYSEGQLAQIRSILDSGIDNIRTALARVEDVNNAKTTVLSNMNQVPCTNTATADGKLVGNDLTANSKLQYPDGSDEVWGNIRNEDGLDPALLFVIEKLGKTDTEALREQLKNAIEQGTVVSTDERLSAGTLASLLEGIELKLGLDITLNTQSGPSDTFTGAYTVTMLLPQDLQGITDLNVISVGADGTISYHPATVNGNYLSFTTTHFSTYGIIGEDTLGIAKEKTLAQIEALSNQIENNDRDNYSRDNWNTLFALIDDAIAKVNDAKTEDEVSDAYTQLLLALKNVPTKRSLGWLWLLILLLVLLVALVIVCYLVWRVRYFDGDEQLLREFHFWRTKVVLYTPEKDGYVLEGWYHDPELTDRAEDEFPMPWHTVKLYAKWNVIEILSSLEEEPIEEMPVEELSEQTNGETPEETMTEEIEETESGEIEKDALALDAPVEEPEEKTEDAEETEEMEEIEEVEEEIENDVPEALVLPQAEEEESEDEPDESEEEEIALLESAEGNTILLLDAADEDEGEEEEIAMLDASPAEGRALLEAPAEGQAVLLLGEVDEDESDEDSTTEDDGYKSSDSYRAWLAFGESEVSEETDEITTTEDGDEVQLFVNEKTGEKYHIRFNLSFRAKMTSLSDEAKGFYRELKDEFLTYKGVKTRISWKNEAVRKGRETVARFAVRDKMLCIFLALDPEAYRDSKYVFESVKDIKAYETIPMMIRVKSDLSCRKVKELIADIMEPRQVKRLDAAPETDYAYLDEDSSTEARLRAGQLRIWAEGPDDTVCANRAAAATLHYLISPEATAEEAEELIGDEMLDALMPPAQEILIVPDEVGEVTIEQLCKKFYVGDEIDMTAMKDKGLLAPEVNYVKVTAEGDMTKRLSVSAHIFDRTAAKMILLTGGDINILQE